jgi:hypothetical protein
LAESEGYKVVIELWLDLQVLAGAVLVRLWVEEQRVAGIYCGEVMIDDRWWRWHPRGWSGILGTVSGRWKGLAGNGTCKSKRKSKVKTKT